MAPQPFADESPGRTRCSGSRARTGSRRDGRNLIGVRPLPGARQHELVARKRRPGPALVANNFGKQAVEASAHRARVRRITGNIAEQSPSPRRLAQLLMAPRAGPHVALERLALALAERTR